MENFSLKTLFNCHTLLLILFLLSTCSCSRIFDPWAKYETLYTFQKDSINIELYTIDSLARNNRAYFRLVINNNTDAHLWFLPIEQIYNEVKHGFLIPWTINISDESQKKYCFPVTLIEPILMSPDYYKDLYYYCSPEGKTEILFGIEFKALHRCDNNKKILPFGKYYIYLEYEDSWAMHGGHVGGKTKTNTVEVVYLKENN